MQIGIMMERERQSQNIIEQLKKENNALKSQNAGISSYETWNAQQIIEWILSVDNSRFSKYEEIVKKVLSEEEPSGKDLKYVNEVDIKRWGITKFADIKILQHLIKQMMVKHNGDNPKMAFSNDEGAFNQGFMYQ